MEGHMAFSQNARTELVLGRDQVKKLSECRVAVFGLGGVGGNAAEALVRAGIGTLDLTDFDRVNHTNLNRQIISLHSTVGQYKTEAARARFLDINPDVHLNLHTCMYLPETAEEFDFDSYDFIVDAIDNVTAKTDLIRQAEKHNVPIICSMGCGNRMDPTKLTITDIYQTQNDPLARIMRQQCRKNGIRKLTVVTSTEQPVKPTEEAKEKAGLHGRKVIGSTSFVPSTAGIMIAWHVVNQLTHNR